jgi:eukaryotic translation initiation factor 2C
LNLPQNRIKTIKAFGKPIGDRFEQRLKFRKWIEVNGQLQQSTQWTHVVDHMRTVFGHQHPFNKELDAVNVGSDADPVWYPQEFLRIVPYQLYKNLLPDKLVEYMLELACKEPNEVRARIEAEGLMGLGVLQESGLQPFVSFPYLPSTEETQKNMWDKCNALSIKPNMLQIPSTRKPQVRIHYTGFHTQPNMDAKVQWNLAGRVKFLETPTSNLPLKYYMIVGPDVTDDHILKTYQTVIDSSIQKYDVGTGTTCLETVKLPDYRKERSEYQEYQGGQKGVNSTYLVAKTHEDLKKDIKEAIELCRERKPGGQLVVLLLNNAQIPAYSAFKDVADRVSGLQSLCLNTSKNRGRSANDNALG